MRPGDACPDCTQGTVYEVSRPGVLVRITGQAPVQAKVYRLQKLRCNLCGKVFTAESPEGVGKHKYDATAGSMIALLKYGTGLPFNRFEGLQGNLGIPLPASTQWDIVHAHPLQQRRDHGKRPNVTPLNVRVRLISIPRRCIHVRNMATSTISRSPSLGGNAG